MDTLQSMRVFARVVEEGSFTGAAQHLNSTTAHVSRSVSDLEAHLQTRLLNRTTRRLALTQAGERYLARCEQILAYVDEAEAEASDAHARPAGKLKMHAMTSFGNHHVLPVISRYQQRYPNVDIDLTLAQRMPDLLDEGYDVSLVLATDLPDSGLISQRLGTAYSIVCASPGYLALKGVPRTPSDLCAHACLQLVTPIFSSNKWLFDGPQGQEMISIGGTFRVNVAEAMAVAIREGMGVGLLPIYSAIPGLRDGSLVRVLPQYTLQSMHVYALYSSRQFLDAKIKTWVDFLRDALPAAMAADEAEVAQYTRR